MVESSTSRFQLEYSKQRLLWSSVLSVVMVVLLIFLNYIQLSSVAIMARS